MLHFWWRALDISAEVIANTMDTLQRGVHLERAVKCIWDETLLINAKVAAIKIYIFTIQTFPRGLNEAPLIV